MRFIDRLVVSMRHIRGRMVESILVVLATAIGVALVAAMAAFIRSYDDQTEYLLSHPAYRELLVEAVGNETELSEAAVEYDPAVTSEATLGFEDIAIALDNTSLVSYGYLADREELSTSGFGGRGGGGGFGGVFRGQAPGGTEGAAGTVGEAPQPARALGTVEIIEPDAQASKTDTPRAEGAAEAQRSDPVSNADAIPGADSESGRGAGRGFNINQFLEVEEGVLTELPLESFPGGRVSEEFFSAYGLVIGEGSGFTNEDLESGNQVLVLGDTLAETLFPDGSAIGTRVRLNAQTYSVIGVLAPTALADTETGVSYNDMGFVPSGETQINFGGNVIRFQRPTRTLRFAVADAADLSGAAAELVAHFDTEFGEGAIHVTAPIDEMRAEREKLSRILTVVLFLAAAGLFIASINLFNLMLMRVIKRTKGIGITRAIGATRRQIARQFLNESALMSFTGAVIGLAVSPIVYRMLRSALIADVSEVTLVSWPFLVVGAAGAFIFSVLFGVYPARQAGRIDAALAIRSE